MITFVFLLNVLTKEEESKLINSTKIGHLTNELYENRTACAYKENDYIHGGTFETTENIEILSNVSFDGK